MGHEKEVQSDMPSNNDKMLKQVQQSKKDAQMDKIANARWKESVKVASKLLAQDRITEEAYDHVVEALSSNSLDAISEVAEKMYPKKVAQRVSTASTQAAQAPSDVHSGPAIVMGSKGAPASDNHIESFASKLSQAFTIGNKSFDEDLTRFGEK
jgi:hypothetical protein